MTNTPIFVNSAAYFYSKEFLEDIKQASERADANPLVANKTEEENRRIIAINIHRAITRAIALGKITEGGKPLIDKARAWACASGYQSLMFVNPVPDQYVQEAVIEIWTAYKNRPKKHGFDPNHPWYKFDEEPK